MPLRLKCMACGPGGSRCPQEAEETSNYCSGHDAAFAILAEERLKSQEARRRAVCRSWLLSGAAFISSLLYVLGSI